MVFASPLCRKVVGAPLVLALALPGGTMWPLAARAGTSPVPMAISDIPLFVNATTPNVLLVIDNSNSMDEAPSGEAAGSASPNSKSEIARGAAKTIINSYAGRMNIGLMAYQQTNVVSYFLNNSYYDVSFNPANYDSGWSGARGSPTHKRFSAPNPWLATDRIFYNVALPFYSPTQEGSLACFSAGANAAPNPAHPDGFWNAETTIGPWDTYNCYRSKTGTSDAELTGTGAYLYWSRYEPSDSDYAQNIYDFGHWNVSTPAGKTWFSADFPGRGYLHVPIKAVDATQRASLFNKLATSQFVTNGATNPALPLQNAGTTPIEGTLLTAKDYFNNTFADAAQGYKTDCYPLPNSCGKNFVVFLTDGMPSTTAAGSIITDSVAGLSSAAGAAKQLLDSNAKVQTYVIGFALPHGVNPAQLNVVAAAGGTQQAYSASDSASLSQAMTAIFADITLKSTAAAGVAANSSRLSSDTQVYQAKFNATDWSGHLLAYGLQNGVPQSTPKWDAASMLPAASARSIVSYKPSTKTGIDFNWNSLDASQQTQLGSQALLNYLAGDASNEGTGSGQYRPRTSGKLGDIVNSAPVYVGKPQMGYRDTIESAAKYSSFMSTNASRSAMLYAGANDGMLHAFDAATGVEKFAYVPSMLYGNLPQLASQSYSHRFYVDGTPTVADAYIHTPLVSGSGAAWRTILVGGLNAGGQGIYALDVTNPSETSNNQRVLWEFTDRQTGAANSSTNFDADLGATFSAPAIVKTRAGWAAIFGNGYNNIAADGAASSTGNAVLYVVNLETGALIKKFDTGRGTNAAGVPNGLSTPAVVDVDGDGMADQVYAGDLQGNLWKFDLTGATKDEWAVAFSGSPLYTATSSVGGLVQPITSKPEVGPHPKGGYFVYIGTGKSVEVGDNALTTPNTFYGIWDNGSAASGGRSTLQQQQVTETQTQNGASYRLVSANVPQWSGTNARRGWSIDLPTSLERVITDARLDDGRIVFASSIPSTAPCEAGGNSWLMELDAITGGRLSSTPFDVNGDGNFNSGDYLIATSTGKPQPAAGVSVQGLASAPTILAGDTKKSKLMNTSNGNLAAVAESKGQSDRRLSWRDLSVIP